MRTPTPPLRRSALGRFFGVTTDARTYAALFYMLLSLATGIFYFTWAVTGISLSAGLLVLIIGIPFIVLFMATVYALSLVEGRIVEVMLGVRMPRRPLYAVRNTTFVQRVKNILSDARTWSTLLYMVLMLPLGILYFTIAIVAISISVTVAIAPILHLFDSSAGFYIDDMQYTIPLWLTPITVALGIVMIVLTLHMARGIGRLHGQLAKHLLVKAAEV